LASLPTSSLGQSVTFTATVNGVVGSGTPTGTVIFEDGSTSIGQGVLSGTSTTSQASFSYALLTAGTHAIKAVYEGDGNYSGATSPTITQVVVGSNPSNGLAMTTGGQSVNAFKPTQMTQTITVKNTNSSGSDPGGFLISLEGVSSNMASMTGLIEFGSATFSLANGAFTNHGGGNWTFKVPSADIASLSAGTYFSVVLTYTGTVAWTSGNKFTLTWDPVQDGQ